MPPEPGAAHCCVCAAQQHLALRAMTNPPMRQVAGSMFGAQVERALIQHPTAAAVHLQMRPEAANFAVWPWVPPRRLGPNAQKVRPSPAAAWTQHGVAPTVG